MMNTSYMVESDHPKISVVTPVYNAEKYIAIAIESILNQTFSDFEFIIIDDGSSDVSWEIIQKYAQQDERIKAFKNEVNLGGCNTLNKGLSLAKGKYIARLDNDDWSYPDRLEKQYHFMEANPEVGIVGGVMEIMDQHGRVIGKRKYNLSDGEIRKRLFRYSPFSHPLVMYRKSILDRVGYYNPAYAPADDYELYFRIGKESKFANLSDVLLKYRVVKGSMTNSLTKKMELTTLRVRRMYENDGYQAGVIDRVYSYLHYLSINIVPSRMKVWLFNVMRNATHDTMSDKKIILITGGSSGLGKTIAQYLDSEGHIVYCASRNATFEETPSLRPLKLDVTSDNECQQAIDEIMMKEKHIDVIINNAGITLTGPTLGFTIEDFKNILDTNCVGSFRLLKAAFSHPNKPKLVINITSLNGFLSSPNFGLYSASKFAMEALGLALRYELSPETKVVNVAPGALRIESQKKMPHKAAREKSILLKWLLPLTSPEDVALAIGKLIDAPSVPPRILVGRDAYLINIMQKILPFSVFDRLNFYVWNKK